MSELFDGELLVGGTGLLSGRTFNYRRLPASYKLEDGRTLTGALCDGVVYNYNYLNDTCYQLLTDVYFADLWGFSPTNTADGNVAAWNRMIAAVPSGSMILLGPGQHLVSSTLKCSAEKDLTIVGTGKQKTTIFANGDFLGLRLTKGTYTVKNLIIKSAHFLHNLGTGADGSVPVPVNQKSLYARTQGCQFEADAYNNHGIYASTVVTLEDIILIQFAGHGIKFDGNIGSDYAYNPSSGQFELTLFKTNSSLSRVVNCSAQEMKGCAFFTTDFDGNLIRFKDCDSRDCRLAGYYDNSFLGCDFDTCHANANEEGNYIQDNPNAACVLKNCYGEQGVKISRITERSIAIGGNHANGITGGLYLRGRNVEGEMRFNRFGITSTGLHFRANNSENGMDFTAIDSIVNSSFHWQFSTANYDFAWMGILGPGAVLPGVQGNPWINRVAARSMLYVRQMSDGGSTCYPSTGLPFDDVPAVQLVPGDRIRRTSEGSLQPARWRVSQGGYLKTTPYTENYTASQTNAGAGGIYNTRLLLSAPTQVLTPGTFLTIGGKTGYFQSFVPDTHLLLISPGYQGGSVTVTREDGSPLVSSTTFTATQGVHIQQLVLSGALPEDFNRGINLRLTYATGKYDIVSFLDFTPNKTLLAFDRAMPLGNNLAISYSTAQLTPSGYGVGSEADRPTLRADHIGWQYYNTTTAQYNTWKGTTW